jgi:hypothetical protein
MFGHSVVIWSPNLIMNCPCFLDTVPQLYLLLFDYVCWFLILLALHQFNPLVIQPQAMTQQATRHARRVYVGGLPPTANEQVITWIA